MSKWTANGTRILTSFDKDIAWLELEMQLESFLENSARQWPDKTAIVQGEDRISYRELESRCNQLAHALIDCGVHRGDRVAIHLDNSIESVVATFAVLKVGAVFMMINPTTKTNKLAFVLNNSRASALFLPSAKLATHRDCWSQTENLRHLIAVGTVDGNDDVADKNCHEMARFMEEHREFVSPPPKRAIDIDLAALIYTSGSTGNPKGVMLTHLNMVSAATSITTYLENTADDIILNVLPLSFDYGLYQVLMGIKFGGTVVLERSFAYPHAILNKMVAEYVTGLPLVPTMLAMLLQMDLSKYNFSSLRYVTNTGAALPASHIQRLRQLVPHLQIYSMYGLTECKRVSYLPPDQIDRRPTSVGKGMPNEEVYLVGDQGQRLGPNEVGELVVRGANVMKGYWELPEETNRMLKDGPIPGEKVLYTGDLFRADEEGYLYFMGRKDDIIKSRGEKVSPKEVENTLHEHPAIADVAVLGVDDDLLGQAVVAIVAPRVGCEISDSEVLRYCAANLEDFMVPKFVEIRDALPRTDNGKIDKKRLEQELLGVPA